MKLCTLSGNRFRENYPMIHLLPGRNETSLAVAKQLRNVHTAIAGMAATVGIASVVLHIVTHNPSQKICIRYMP